MTALPPALTGAVYDRGYRPYHGPRGGRREATLALWRQSVRRASLSSSPARLRARASAVMARSRPATGAATPAALNTPRRGR